MVFNWFRRKFDNPEPDSSKDSEQTVESAPEQLETPAADEAAPEPVSNEVATDYLAWAKAAYQNIQQQESAAAQAAATVAEEVTDAVAPVLAVEEATTEPLAVAVESEASDIEAPTVIISDTAEATTSDAEDLPIWARDDRQQRLEQLKASAIETAEPEAQTPDIALDDDFLWSAKVLADRGRTPEQVSLDEINWLKKLRQGLDKTRRGFVNQLKALIGQGPLNADAVESIETLLLQADVGIEATDYVIETLQTKLRQEALPPEAAIAYLKQILRDLLDKPFESNYSSEFLPESNQLNIWLLVGVNGVGKTTTIGKLAHMSQSSGYKCLIAAGDTFRAAAVEQVKVWGQRSGIEVIANPGQNTDPAAVVFDAISAARSRETELLLVDTAGRLQNKKNLMDELSKIRRIIDKQASTAQIESLLVLDATLGQNGLRQAQVFAEAAKLSGVILTKLDGTAKGGVALAVVQQLGLPIRFIGAGEGIEDLRPFSSYEFVEALLSG
ncbi:signal recognition particle-docking protein FtsY [Chamaesiphon minutus]|uniref:Signal recognition particle receptor FtsY n=1 Tax=Chamaesiphon minutus (strain ATCC 27169 / PCC 6605) TaxID=1173020 RepID=K9UJI8_CHAP6|nr:signal recognition particle-docking protein FtsY [Chamaesiphon minutus]AFY94803.1 signal recognition particle-docking protein FtsY [Chamaesiphon minutus PCC 6605]